MAGFYTVKPGDSLASIAGDVYGNQRMFQMISYANGGMINLTPGMVLNMPDEEANPYVSQGWMDYASGVSSGGGGTTSVMPTGGTAPTVVPTKQKAPAIPAPIYPTAPIPTATYPSLSGMAKPAPTSGMYKPAATSGMYKPAAPKEMYKPEQPSGMYKTYTDLLSSGMPKETMAQQGPYMPSYKYMPKPGVSGMPKPGVPGMPKPSQSGMEKYYPKEMQKQPAPQAPGSARNAKMVPPQSPDDTLKEIYALTKKYNVPRLFELYKELFRLGMGGGGKSFIDNPRRETSISGRPNTPDKRAETFINQTPRTISGRPITPIVKGMAKVNTDQKEMAKYYPKEMSKVFPTLGVNAPGGWGGRWGGSYDPYGYGNGYGYGGGGGGGGYVYPPNEPYVPKEYGINAGYLPNWMTGLFQLNANR